MIEFVFENSNLYIILNQNLLKLYQHLYFPSESIPVIQLIFILTKHLFKSFILIKNQIY